MDLSDRIETSVALGDYPGLPDLWLLRGYAEIVSEIARRRYGGHR